jgi:hypothetical protein
MRSFGVVLAVLLNACASGEVSCNAHLSPINKPAHFVDSEPSVPFAVPPMRRGSTAEEADEVFR